MRDSAAEAAAGMLSSEKVKAVERDGIQRSLQRRCTNLLAGQESEPSGTVSW